MAKGVVLVEILRIPGNEANIEEGACLLHPSAKMPSEGWSG